MTPITSRQEEEPIYLSDLKLRIPLRHKYMTRESYFGAGALPPVTAEKAGFPTTIEAADPGKMRMDKETRRRQAKVHFFRYNCLPPASVSIIAGLGPGETQQGMNIAAEMSRLGTTFQNKMISNAKEDEWMVRYVEGEVDEYTWEVHLFNLRLQSATLAVAPANEVVADRDTRLSQSAAFEAAFQWHKQKFVDALHAAREEATHLNSQGSMSTNATLEWINDITERCERMLSYNPFPPLTESQIRAGETPQAPVTERPRYYHEMTVGQKMDFWGNERWSIDAAASLWFHFLTAVDIKANFDARYKGGMGRQMKQTWCVICDCTFSTVIAFRKEQKRIENAGPSFKERVNILTSAAYDSHFPYKTFRSIEHTDVAGTGIEIVLVVPTIVPASKTTPKKRGGVSMYKEMPMVD
jgi:hypothetical protein